MNEKLRRFQLEFVRAVENPKYDTVALSGPRGLGKTFIAAHVLARCLTPGDELHQPGKEYILGAASIEQARLTYQFIRAELEPTGEYRWIDSATRLGATHRASNTKLRAISSNAKTSLGLVNVPLVVLDEPGALENVGGSMLSDSLFTAQGKVGSKLKLVLIGTLAPMATAAGHWWFDLVAAGTTGTKHVQLFQGDAESWDDWKTIRKANPLTAISKDFSRKLRGELAEALGDPRLAARFKSYRLNLPSADESTMLLDVADWELVTARTVPERSGQPIVGIDLGGGRAWSSAVAVWESGRVEALALAPGIPDIEAQEKRDRVSPGLYARLVQEGTLTVAEGLRVQPAALLWELVRGMWGQVALVVCDRFRLTDLQDAIDPGVALEPRVTRWSDAAADIRALRKGAKDGPLSVDDRSRALLIASLAAAHVKSDDAGNTRLVKNSSNNSRDDVAAALTLAAGAFARYPATLAEPSAGPILV